MADTYIDRRNTEFKQETGKVASTIRTVAGFSIIGSAAFAGGATYLHVSEASESTILALVVAALVGLMTVGAMVTFTSALIRLLPRFDPKHQLLAGVVTAIAFGAIVAISGTSNAIFLAYPHARAMEDAAAIERAEAAFAGAQNGQRQLGQIAPLLETGEETAQRLQDIEKRGGNTGAGAGPIYSELVTQGTRLKGAKDSILAAKAAADTKIEIGKKIIADMRAAMKDETLSRQDRQRALENGLTRLSSVIIELRQEMPLATLDAIATMLQTPITLPRWSDDPDTRARQEQTVARLQQEFAPVGRAVADAVRALSDRMPRDELAYRHMSPAATVFAHAGDLAWLIGIGYSLDILPYLAIGLVLIAHRQIDAHDQAGHEDGDHTPPPLQPRIEANGAGATIHPFNRTGRGRHQRPNGGHSGRRASQ